MTEEKLKEAIKLKGKLIDLNDQIDRLKNATGVITFKQDNLKGNDPFVSLDSKQIYDFKKQLYEVLSSAKESILSIYIKERDKVQKEWESL